MVSWRRRHWRRGKRGRGVGPAHADFAGPSRIQAISRRISARRSRFRAARRRGACPVRRERRRQINSDPDARRRARCRPRAAIAFAANRSSFRAVHHARTLGISAVFQEFSLVPTLTVEENLFLGAELTSRGFLDKSELHRRADDILKRLGFPLRPRQRVQDLSRAEQQMVEIAKAFRTDLSVLILDEPTASLTDREAQRLFAMIEQAKSAGRRHHLRHAPHERDPQHRRSRHRVARRQTRGDARRRRGRRRAAAATDDRTRHQRRSFPDRISAGAAAARSIAGSPPRTMRSADFRSRSAPARSSGSPAWSAAASRWSGAPASAWSGSPPAASCSTASDVTGRSAREMLDRGALLSAAGPARGRAGDDAQRAARTSRCPALGGAPVHPFRLPRPRQRARQGSAMSPTASICSRATSSTISSISPVAISRRSCWPGPGLGGEAVHLRRADRRRRRRHARRHLRLHSRSLRERRRRPADLVGSAGNPPPDQPHLRDVPGRPAGRACRRGDHAGPRAGHFFERTRA